MKLPYFRTEHPGVSHRSPSPRYLDRGDWLLDVPHYANGRALPSETSSCFRQYRRVLLQRFQGPGVPSHIGKGLHGDLGKRTERDVVLFEEGPDLFRVSFLAQE